MLQVGDKFGSYDVIKLLGQGGMGSVFLLKGVNGRLCVVKILDPSIADDVDSRVRFLREAQLAQEAKSPYLIKTYDIGEDPDTGLCYILMEYVPGGSLQNKLTSCGKLSIDDALSYTRQIALALSEINQHGIVHRDIKPDNIMFGARGEIKLADLGIARNSSVGSTTITKGNIVIGTPAYMSPEQMIDSHGVDIRSDIYSLGIVLFEMVAGSRPFPKATFMDLMAKALKGKRLPDVRKVNAEVPRPVARLIAKMCAPNLARRFATPDDLVAAIDALSRGEAPRRIDPKAYALGGVAAALVTIIAVVLGVTAPSPETPKPSEEVLVQPLKEEISARPTEVVVSPPEPVEPPEPDEPPESVEPPKEEPAEEDPQEEEPQEEEPTEEEAPEKEAPAEEKSTEEVTPPAQPLQEKLQLDRYTFIVDQVHLSEAQRIWRIGVSVFDKAYAYLGADSIAVLSKVERIECDPWGDKILLNRKKKTLTIGIYARETDILNAFANLAMLAVEDGYSTENQPIVKYLRKRLKWKTMRGSEAPNDFNERVLDYLCLQDQKIFGKYFRARKAAYRVRQLAGHMTRHDYVGVLSIAAGKNLFPAYGSSVRRSLSRVKCGGPSLSREEILEGLRRFR